MHNKLLALGLVSALAALAGYFVARDRGAAAPDAATQAMALVPQTLNGYGIQRRWRNSLPDNVIEDGALYAAAALSAPDERVDGVQLDFFRNAWHAHNAAFCSVRKGERLRSETRRTMKTRTGEAVFNLAFLSVDQELRLVAGTQCSSRRCVETRSVVSAPWESWSWRSMVSPDSEAVVPTVLVLVRRHITSDQQMVSTERQLLAEFEGDVADLDLLPAQRLAALLDQAARM